ncbi:DUF788-domain-containing protein [Meredithblackwellia eburnea MCA 4105]
MAGASAKRIAAQNGATLAQLRIGFAISNLIYLGHLFIFRSGRSWFRLFAYLSSEIIAVVLWAQLADMAAKGGDLAAAGLTSYIFDIIYVTWFVHVTTAVIWAKFWYLYLVIPGYALYRFGSFVIPFIRGSKSSARAPSSTPSASGKGGSAASATEDAPSLSKRQEKLKKRSEKGNYKLEYRAQQ